MARQTVLSQTPRKKPGPPATGKGTLIGVRLQPPELAQLDAWRAKQDDPKPSRPEAIRHHLKRSIEIAETIGNTSMSKSTKTHRTKSGAASVRIPKVATPAKTVKTSHSKPKTWKY